MTWHPSRNGKWRNYLTAEEFAVIAKCDAVTKKIAELRKKNLSLLSDRKMIQNRAIKRAKYAERNGE